MKEFLGRHWKSFLPFAILLDAAIAFGPAIFVQPSYGFTILGLRWSVMIIGVYAAEQAKLQAGFKPRFSHYSAVYFVFGFTAAALLNAAFHPGQFVTA